MGCAPSTLEEADSIADPVSPQNKVGQSDSNAVPVSARRPGRAVEVIGEAPSPNAPLNGTATSIPLLNEALEKQTDLGSTSSLRVKRSINSLRNSASSSISRKSSTSHGQSEKLPSLPGSVPTDEIMGTNQQTLSTSERAIDDISSFEIKPLSSTIMSIKSLMASPDHGSELTDKPPEPELYDKHLSAPINPAVLTTALDGNASSSEVEDCAELVNEQSDSLPFIGSGKENVTEELSLKGDGINGSGSENGGVSSKSPSELPPVTNDYDDCDHMYQNIEIRNGELYMGPKEVVEPNERRNGDPVKNFQQILDENDQFKTSSEGDLENEKGVDINMTSGDENNDQGAEPEQESKKDAVTHELETIGMNEQSHDDAVSQSSATSTVGTEINTELLHTHESLDHEHENGNCYTGATETEADPASHDNSTFELHSTYPSINEGTTNPPSTLTKVLSPSSSPNIAFEDEPKHNEIIGLPDDIHDPTLEQLTTASVSDAPFDDITSLAANDAVAGPSNETDATHRPAHVVLHGGAEVSTDFTGARIDQPGLNPGGGYSLDTDEEEEEQHQQRQHRTREATLSKTSLVTQRSVRSMAVSISDLLSDSDFNSDAVDNSLASSAAAMLAFPKRSTTAKYRLSHAAETRFANSDGGMTTKDDSLTLDSLDGGMVEKQFEESNVFSATSSDDNYVQKLDEGGDTVMEQMAAGETESNSNFKMDITSSVGKDHAWQDNEGDADIVSSKRTEGQSKPLTIGGTDLLRGESENILTGEMNDLEGLLASTSVGTESLQETYANTESFENGMENTKSYNYKAIGIKALSDETHLDEFGSEHTTRLRQMVKFASEDLVIEEFDHTLDFRESEVLVQKVAIDNEIDLDGNSVNLETMIGITNNLGALEESSNISSVITDEKTVRWENQLVEEGMSGKNIENVNQFSDQKEHWNEFLYASQTDGSEGVVEGTSHLEEFGGAGSPLNTARELANETNAKLYEKSAEQDPINSFSEDELDESPDVLTTDIEMGIMSQTILEQYTDEEAEAGSNPRSAVGKLGSGLGKNSSNEPVKVSLVDEERQDEDTKGNDDTDKVMDGNTFVHSEEGNSIIGELITVQSDLSFWTGDADHRKEVNEPNSQTNTGATEVTASWNDITSFPSLATVENNASDPPFEATALEHHSQNENFAEMQVESIGSDAAGGDSGILQDEDEGQDKELEEGKNETSEQIAIDREDNSKVCDAKGEEQSDKGIGDTNEVSDDKVSEQNFTDIYVNDCERALLDGKFNKSGDKSGGHVDEIKRDEITESEGDPGVGITENEGNVDINPNGDPGNEASGAVVSDDTREAVAKETHIISENANSYKAGMEVNEDFENEISGGGMEAANNVTEHRVIGDDYETHNDTVNGVNSDAIIEASNEVTDEASNDTINASNSDGINGICNEAIDEASNATVNEVNGIAIMGDSNETIDEASNDTVNEVNSIAVTGDSNEIIDEASNDTVNEVNSIAIMGDSNETIDEASNDTVNEVNSIAVKGDSNEIIDEASNDTVNEVNSVAIMGDSNETIDKASNDTVNEANSVAIMEAINETIHEASNDTVQAANSDAINEASIDNDFINEARNNAENEASGDDSHGHDKETVSEDNGDNINETSNETVNEASNIAPNEVNCDINEANNDTVNGASNFAPYEVNCVINEANNETVNGASNMAPNEVNYDINEANNDTVNESSNMAPNEVYYDINEANNDTVNGASNMAPNEVNYDINEANNDTVNASSNMAPNEVNYDINEANNDTVNGASNMGPNEVNYDINEANNDTVNGASNMGPNEVNYDINEANNETVNGASNMGPNEVNYDINEANNDTVNGACIEIENNSIGDVVNEASNEEVNCENENNNENEDEHLNKTTSPEPDEVSLKNELNQFISQQFSRSGTPLEDLSQNSPTLALPRTPTVIHEALSGVS